MDFIPNGRRKIRGSRPDGIGMATKGNRNHYASRDDRPALLVGDGYPDLLSARIPVRAAVRPMADASDEGGNGPLARRRRTIICPGCGCEKTSRNARACFCW